MLGSRVCWQLLLGWALLLGQPVFGDSDTAEEPPLAESEEPVAESQGPEEPVPEAEEPDLPVPEAEEPDSPVPDSQEQEELVPMLEEQLGRPLNEEDLEMLFGGRSEDELETRAQENREWVESMRNDPFSRSTRYLKQIAVQHHNQKSNYVYKSYENGNVKFKKAIGSMIYIKFLLVKTSCTKEEGEALIRQLNYPDVSAEMKHCEVPPASKQEIKECSFTLFQDVRNRHWPNYVVTRHNCVPFAKQRENYY